MTVDSGEPCNIKLHEGSGTIIKSLVPVARPSRGSLAPQNSVNITYRPRPGVQGVDRFTFAVVGIKNGAPGRALVSVGVFVRGNGNSVPMASSAGSRSAKVRGAPQNARQPNASQLACLQQAGASIDPVTKRWTFYTTERDMMSRSDMFRLCMAGGDRQKAKAIAVRERNI